MKKSVIALIVAAVLIVSGGLLFFVGMQRADFNLTQKPVQKVYTASGSFQNIQIDTGICDVRFFKTDGDLTVHCTKTEKLEYVVLVEDGILRISAMDMHQWYDFIGINIDEPIITVYLPEDTYESLYIQTDTGDVEIPQDFSFDTAEIRTNTGDIAFAAAVAKSLITANSTGDTEIYGVCPTYLECRSSTGDMALSDIHVSGDIHIQRSTGEITATDVTCQNLTSQSNTGDVDFTDVLVAEALQITTTTGEVTVLNCDAATVNINTDTGDVTGHFLSPKWFVTDTSTGDVVVPISRDSGECSITTSTGDIVFF